MIPAARYLHRTNQNFKTIVGALAGIAIDRGARQRAAQMNSKSDEARKAIVEALIAKLEAMPDEQRSEYIRQMRDDGTLAKMSNAERVKLFFGPNAEAIGE